MAELPAAADAIVIGGGIMGCSTLYHLATLGITNTVLIERDTLGAGSTSRSAGGFRAQFSDELNIKMAVENIRRLGAFDEEVGGDIDFRQWGYLFLLDETHLPRFAAAVELQNRLGVPSEVIGHDAILEIVPGLDLDGISGATWCPIDGYCTPEAVGQGYARAASRLGAAISQGVAVTSIDVADGRVVGVTTSRGSVSSPVVVLATGAWAPELAVTAGLELPVTPVKRHVVFTIGDGGLPREIPNTIDFASGFYFHREGTGLLLGGREQTMEGLATVALDRLPLLEHLELRPGWWGYYEMSPDGNGIVGACDEPSGMLYATGFSGHGFQQGPVIGEHLAELVAGVEPTFDLSAMSLERFATGAFVPEQNLV